MASNGMVDIDVLPLPSSLDLPPSLLPDLPSVDISGGATQLDDILSSLPLPPQLPIDEYELEYGPSTINEPQLEAQLTDGEIPRFDEVNEQYEFLRRTLSHSRRRYSSRFKRPRPKSRPNDATEQSSLDFPGQNRDESSLDSGRSRLRSPDHPLHQQHQRSNKAQSARRPQGQRIRRVGHSSAYQPRANNEREAGVDNLGRTYYFDHATHTINYDGSLTQPNGEERGEHGDPAPVGLDARREMLNRRYQSLHRSFRTAHHRRRDPTQEDFPTNLTPVETAGAISYLPLETPSDTGTTPRVKKERQKSTKNWFTFSRNKSRHKAVSPQTSSSSSITSERLSPTAITPDDIFSPLSPPPLSLEELGISGAYTPSTVTANNNTANTDTSNGPTDSTEVSIGPEALIAIIDQPCPPNNNEQNTSTEEQQSVTNEQSIPTRNEQRMSTGGMANEQHISAGGVASEQHISTGGVASEQRISTGATDLDQAAAAAVMRQRIRTSRTSTRQSEGGGGDTDDETNETLSPRTSVTTPQPEETTPTITITPVESTGETVREKKKQGLKVAAPAKLTEALKMSPALKFVTRPDLYSFLNSAGEAGEVFFSQRALMELVQRIRADNNLFAKYQHSRNLVQALNSFADTDRDLPEGWERKLNKQGKIFFIDHEHQLTTFIDPRLPSETDKPLHKVSTASIPTMARRVYSTSDEPELRPHHSTIMQSQSVPGSSSSSPSLQAATEGGEGGTTDERSYEEQVVEFFRQPNVEEIIAQRYRRALRPQMKEAITDIRQNGVSALERVQLSGGGTALEMTLILSIFEEDISALRPRAPTQQAAANSNEAPPTQLNEEGGAGATGTIQRQKQAFAAKLQTFKLQLARLGFAQGSRLKFNIRRDHLLEDAYEHVMKSEIRHLQRKRLNIAFKGEDGLDYGGPSREFFFLLSRNIFNPYFGLFEYSANDTYTIQINPTSSFIQNNLDWFRFAGRIVGLVIAQGFLLDVFFTRPTYKAILGKRPLLRDLESLEPAFYNSLIWIQENDPEPLDLTFTIEEEAFDQLTMHELKEGGADIPVLNENKQEYIDLMVAWRLDRGVTEQTHAFLKGFSEIMPRSLVQQFDSHELEFLIAGTLEVDVDDWKNNTDYRNGYHADHPVILWFWKAVEMFDNEQRLRLLQFVTGTSSVPYEGFKALRGSSGPKRFTIDFFNEVRSLPRSHTCFNRLDLPPYPTFEILYEKLRTAIEEGGTFGIE